MLTSTGVATVIGVILNAAEAVFLANSPRRMSVMVPLRTESRWK